MQLRVSGNDLWLWNNFVRVSRKNLGTCLTKKKKSSRIWYSPVTIAWRVGDGAKNPWTHGWIACYMPEWQMNGFCAWAFDLHPSISIQNMVLEIGRLVNPRVNCLAWVLCLFEPVPEETCSMFFLLEKSWDALMTWIWYRYTMDMSGWISHMKKWVSDVRYDFTRYVACFEGSWYYSSYGDLYCF